jgi:hypothetical protein
MGDRQRKPVRGEGDDADRDPPMERIATASERQPPDFIIIGTQRGGTTSMYRYLCEHPEVGAAFRKEIHFFDDYYDRGLDWYLAHFPKRGEYPLVGEASPFYLVHPEAAQRASQLVPGARLIALLRDPVARAWSMYHLKTKRGLETLPFAEALDREQERLAADPDPVGAAWRHHSYQARGEYAAQLEGWFAAFPREQVLVLKSEDFFADPAREMAGVHRFLGLSPVSGQRYKPYHLADYPPLDPAIDRRLRDYFAPHNRRLADLLGRDFGWDA